MRNRLFMVVSIVPNRCMRIKPRIKSQVWKKLTFWILTRETLFMKYYMGIDVSKASLDADWRSQSASYGNNDLEIKKLIKRLRALQSKGELALVVCEATGGYEQRLMRFCHKAQLPIHVAHANKVRYFAKSQGLLAKTDKLDARVLSDYGRLLQPKADSVLLNENTKKIAELLKRREQLQADKKRETNRIDKIINPDIKRSIEEHVKWLNKKIKEIDKKLLLLKQSDDVSSAHDLLTSIPAIGDISAYYLLSCLPEIGKTSHKALAALVGVAPFNHDSGNNQGKRFIKGGRSRLRQILYMAAITAIRCNTPLKAFYVRLRNNGKPVKVALVAIIRKLISMINSVMKRQTPWQKEYSR